LRVEDGAWGGNGGANDVMVLAFILLRGVGYLPIVPPLYPGFVHEIKLKDVI
jgi:hypothetical protein